MSLAGDALQVLNLIIGLVAVDMVNLVTFGDSSVVEFPNVALKGSKRRLIPAALVAAVVDTVKALVRVVDNLNFHDESLLQLKIARQARQFNKFYPARDCCGSEERRKLCSYQLLKPANAANFRGGDK